MKDIILKKIPTECPWRDTLYWYNTIDSTNTQAKVLAKDGAPHGTVLIAGTQTGGRGRMGRIFQSQEGGAYLSVILRPNCPPAQLMHLTCAVAVAMTEAIKTVCGLQVDIKWINDLVWEKKKLGGILTEMALNAKNGLIDYAIVGIGINCSQTTDSFPTEICNMATSLSMASGNVVTPEALLPEMVLSLYRMDRNLLTDVQTIMDNYRKQCITLGSQVKVIRGESVTHAVALSLDNSGGLLVRYADGQQETVSSGEVSVRGFYDYI